MTMANTTPSISNAVSDELRAAFRSGKTLGIRWRMEQLGKLKQMLVEKEDELIDAIVADLGKPRFEAYTTEIGFLISEIDYTCKHLASWMKPKKVKSSMVVQPAKSRIYRDPLGVALIIGAWNYPVGLAIGPLIGAIAAGNCVCLKPSEVAHHSSVVMAKLLPQYMDNECLRVVEGGVPETTALLEQKWDKIFYTGNGKVGKIVMTAAAQHLTPVTLELGGKSPAIIDAEVDLEVAARRIVFGKFTNAGQTCVAPDYTLVHESAHNGLVAALKSAITEFYGDDAKQSPDYGRIINERHHERLVGLLESGSVAHGGQHDVSEKYFEPTILTDVGPDSKAMADEIFGPILPILRINSIDEAIDFVNDRAKPLALYVFTKNKENAHRILRHTSSGGGSINHIWLHLAVPGLPFGGVGESGMGSYHGRHTFNAFSHRKSILDKSTLIDPSLMYPPYTDRQKQMMRRVL